MRVSPASRAPALGEAAPPSPRREVGINPDPNARPVTHIAPSPAQGLKQPRPAPPGVIARAIAALRGTDALKHLSGDAWDLAFVGVLDVKWRSLRADVGKLSAGDAKRLADAVVRDLRARGCIRDDETARMAAYAVRLMAQRDADAVTAAASHAATATPPAVASPEVMSARPLNAMTDSDAVVNELRALRPSAHTTQAERDARALQAQRIVERQVRYLMAHDPARLDAFVRQLAQLDLPVARLPITFRDGWSVAVADGRVQGTVAAGEPYVSARVFGHHYRVGLHDMRSGRRELQPRPVDIVYTFADGTRTLSAAAYAQILIDQHAFVQHPGWPKEGDPFNLTTVRAYFQHLCDSQVPMREVFAQWQQYLSAFYVHANAADLQGAAGGLGLGLYDTDRLTNEMQGVVNDLLPATTGQRLLDCEFFAGLAHNVFGHITQTDGSPRFDVYWVALDTHESQLIVERGSGARAWALSNNDQISVEGTTFDGVDQAMLAAVGQHILWGAPAIFSIDANHDKADTAEHSTLGLPAAGAYVYDGRTLSRVTGADRRAFLIFAATRANPFESRYSDFVGTWRS